MALYHNWDVKNGFAYVLTFFSLISDGLGGVCTVKFLGETEQYLHSFFGTCKISAIDVSMALGRPKTSIPDLKAKHEWNT